MGYLVTIEAKVRKTIVVCDSTMLESELELSEEKTSYSPPRIITPKKLLKL